MSGALVAAEARRPRRAPWVAVVALGLRLLGWTLRPRVAGWRRAQRLLDRGEPVAFALRHGDGLVILLTRSLPRVTVLVSRSADGDRAAALLDRFGQATARGSTSRGGAAGLRSLLRCLGSRRPPLLAVDGPRGPAGVPGPGAAALGRLAGAWVVPLSAACAPHRRLASWDRTLVPLPFARSVVVVGRPIPPGIEVGDASECLARRLAEGGARAQRLCGVAP